MMIQKRTIFILILLVLLTLISSCGKDSKNPLGPGSDKKTEIAPETTIIQNMNAITDQEVTDNSVTYVFTGQAPEIKSGDVLVGSQENWYLRKAEQVTVQDSVIIIETEPARLTDAFVTAKVDTMLNLESTSVGKIVFAEKGVSLVDGNIDLTGVVLYSGTINDIQADMAITDGMISFDPDLDIGLEIDNGVKEFHLVPHGELFFECDITATVNAAFDDSAEKTLISLAYVNWIYIPGTVIAIPVMTTITFKAHYELTTEYWGTVSTGLTSNYQVDVGAKYEDHAWTPIWKSEAEKEARETTWLQNGDCYLRCSVIPEISTTIASFAGPYINVEPYLMFDGSIGGQHAWYWKMVGGIAANLGFNVNFLGYDIANYTKTFELVEGELAADFSDYGGDPHEINGISFVTIPGGSFQMGVTDNSGYLNEKPVHTVTVSTFEMSVYEITNAQYAKYLNEALATGDIKLTFGAVYGETGSWSGQRYLDIGCNYDSSNQCWVTYNSGVFSVTPGYEDWPVVAVTWYGAKAFTEHYGIDLPREAEWEYASCWGNHQYKYGTNDGTISNSNANYFYNVGHPVAVGSYPPNPFGLHDLSGNVCEWCIDWYGSYSSEIAIDPLGAQTGTSRVCRGGDWDGINGDSDCRSTNRDHNPPGLGVTVIGFRVVRRPAQQ